jgi:ribosomal-protein-serine acetyltransferase
MFSAPVRPGLELRLLEERHSSIVFALADRERQRLRQWLPWVDATKSEDDILAFIRRSLEQFANNNGFAAGIWEHGQFVGVIGLHPIDWRNRRVEIGYWVGSEFEGRGIITDACRAIVKHLFVELELNRVEIHCASANARSIGVPRRLGFAHEGVRREMQLLHGRYVDAEVYVMLRSDLRAGLVDW